GTAPARSCPRRIADVVRARRDHARLCGRHGELMRHLSLLTFAVLAASVTVAGCSYAPAQALRMPEQPLAAPADVEHKDGTFEGGHGTKLYEQSWRPRTAPKAVVVIVHGLKDHSTRYKALAERLAQQGFAVHAFDLRGHGRSEGVRVWVDEFDD